MDLIQSAANNESNPDYSFYLDGDINQMSIQKSFLQTRGFNIQQNNVYPCLKPEDKKKALEAIWNSKVEGWWHYLDEYVELNICTKQEFQNAF